MAEPIFIARPTSAQVSLRTRLASRRDSSPSAAVGKARLRMVEILRIAVDLRREHHGGGDAEAAQHLLLDRLQVERELHRLAHALVLERVLALDVGIEQLVARLVHAEEDRAVLQALDDLEPGILRHARQRYPNIDVVVTYFVNPEMLKLLQSGETPLPMEAKRALRPNRSPLAAYPTSPRLMAAIAGLTTQLAAACRICDSGMGQ